MSKNKQKTWKLITPNFARSRPITENPTLGTYKKFSVCISQKQLERIFLKSLRIIFIMYIIRSETFIY